MGTITVAPNSTRASISSPHFFSAASVKSLYALTRRRYWAGRGRVQCANCVRDFHGFTQGVHTGRNDKDDRPTRLPAQAGALSFLASRDMKDEAVVRGMA
jgi:hypothetical protein